MNIISFCCSIILFFATLIALLLQLWFFHMKSLKLKSSLTELDQLKPWNYHSFTQISWKQKSSCEICCWSCWSCWSGLSECKLAAVHFSLFSLETKQPKQINNFAWTTSENLPSLLVKPMKRHLADHYWSSQYSINNISPQNQMKFGTYSLHKQIALEFNKEVKELTG